MKRNKIIKSAMLLALCLPALSACPFIASSCKSNFANFDLSKLDFSDGFDHSRTLFVYVDNPSNVDDSFLATEIMNNKSLKKEIIDFILTKDPSLEGLISENDIMVEPGVSNNLDNSNEVINLVNAIPYHNIITIKANPNSKHVFGETVIGSGTYDIQAFPTDFEIQSNDISESFKDSFKVKFTNAFKIDDLFKYSKKELINSIYDLIVNYEVSNNNETIPLYQFIENEVGSLITEILNKKYPTFKYTGVPIDFEHDLKFDLSSTFFDNIEKFYDTKDSPLDFIVNVFLSNDKFDSELHSLAFQCDDFQIFQDKIDLSHLSQFDDANLLKKAFLYSPCCDEYSATIVNTKLFSLELHDELMARITSVANELPLVSNEKNKEKWFVIDDFSFPHTISTTPGLQRNIAVTIRPNDKIAAPLTGSYTFNVPYFISMDRRVSLNNSELVNQLNSDLFNASDAQNSLIYIDANDPTDVTDKQLKSELSENHILLNKIAQSLSNNTSKDVSVNDFDLVFSDKSQGGDYSAAGTGANGKIVKVSIESSGTSRKLSDATDEDAILIHVQASNSKYDISKLPQEYRVLGSEENPLDWPGKTPYLNLDKVPTADINEFLKGDGEWNKQYLGKMSKLIKAISKSDYNLKVVSDTVDLSKSCNTIKAVLQPSQSSCLTGDSIDITLYVKQATQKVVNISNFSSTFSEKVEVASPDIMNTTASEINSALASHLDSIKSEVKSFLCKQTQIDYLAEGVDYQIDYKLNSSYNLSSDPTKPTTLAAYRVTALESSSKLTGSFIFNVLFYGKQAESQYVNYSLSVRPTKDNSILNAKYDYHVGGSKCGGRMALNYINVSFKFNKTLLRQKLDTDNNYKNAKMYASTSLSIKKLYTDGVISDVVASLDGSWDCWCIASHSSFTNLAELSVNLKASDMNPHFERQCKCNGTNVGFYAGDNRNNNNDDIMSAFHFVIDYDSSNPDSIRLVYGYNNDTPTTLRWGCRGMSNMYDHSNNRCDSQVSATASNEQYK